MPATASKGRTLRVRGQVRLLVPPKIASSSTAPTVDTTIEGTKDTDQAGRSDGEDLATGAAGHSVFAQAARIHAPN
jgi:hypothetical protein